MVDNLNPFLFYNTHIVKGRGRAIVCCIGDSSLMGQRKLVVNFGKEKTHSSIKLNNLKKFFSKKGI